MILADLCVRRPVFATMFMGVLVVLGWFSYKRLGVDLYPKVDMPMVMVQTYLPGAAPEETEARVTKPLEEAINTVTGIDELRSVTPGRRCRASWSSSNSIATSTPGCRMFATKFPPCSTSCPMAPSRRWSANGIWIRCRS